MLNEFQALKETAILLASHPGKSGPILINQIPRPKNSQVAS